MLDVTPQKLTVGYVPDLAPHCAQCTMLRHSNRTLNGFGAVLRPLLFGQR